MAKESGSRLIANNKKAYHDYFIEDTYEAGIELAGTEVKSMRMGKCSIKESFIQIEHGEVFVYGMHISPYEKGNIFNKDPLRTRKLLLHQYEIRKIAAKIRRQGTSWTEPESAPLHNSQFPSCGSRSAAVHQMQCALRIPPSEPVGIADRTGFFQQHCTKSVQCFL